MPRVVGIDLGTTNSLVAYVENKIPKIIPDLQGNRLVPSVVTFLNDGSHVVGETAKNHRVSNAQNTVYSVKRLMGRGYDDVKAYAGMLPYQISPQGEELVKIHVSGKELTPPEVSAMVLKQLKQQAEAFFKEEVKQAVITVPAYFNDGQRQATKDAGRIAGLEVLRIVNEPTAASLAYGLDKKKQGVVAVYDLGGGTFDISILNLHDGIFEVLSTNGDTALGGDDFDRAIAGEILREIQSRLGIDLSQEVEAVQALLTAAEKAKIALSEQPKTVLELNARGKNYRRELSRAEFETWVADLVKKTVQPCKNALKDAGLAAEEVDEVILVGGATRIPCVRRAVKEIFGKEPHCELNPDEVVALGAAIQADILSGEIKDMLLLDVTPLSLGMETLGGVMEKIIPRNSRIPTSASEVFTTSVEGQISVDIHILQGERELVKDCRSLGRFQLKGIAPQPAGMPRIEVTFLIDQDGILNVRAKDQRSGQSQEIAIKSSYGLTEAEVDKLVEESIEHAESDLEQRMLIEYRIQGEVILKATEKGLKEETAHLTAKEKKKIEKGCAELREALKGSDFRQLKAKCDQLEEATKKLAEQLMNGVVRTAVGGKRISDIK